MRCEPRCRSSPAGWDCRAARNAVASAVSFTPVEEYLSARMIQTAFPGQPGPQRRGFADQDSHAGPPLEQLIDFSYERPWPLLGWRGRVDADELDPEMNSQVGHHIGQQRPQLLSPDKLLPSRRDVSPVHGGAGLERA